MKQGCLFLILVIALAAYGYWRLLAGTPLEEMYWIPPALGIAAAIVVANLQGIFLSLKHIAISKRSQTEWREGDLVVLSGRIQAQKSPITAPISAKPVVIAEYEIYRYSYVRRNGKQESVKNTDYRGCLMTPCYVQSSFGQVGLVGFPLLSHISFELYEEPQHFENIAKFLYKNTLSVMLSSPLAALSELNKVLKDDDGDVNANFRHADAIDLRTMRQDDFSDPETDIEQNDLTDKTEDIRSATSADDQTGLIEAINYIKSKEYRLQETAILNGSEVTVMGTYLGSKRQINIGSGLSNLSHAIYLGPASQVLNKNLFKTIILSVIFLSIFLIANYYLLQQIGIDPKRLLESYISETTPVK